jgi:transcriptional regulator with XRE-family HTH domain
MDFDRQPPQTDPEAKPRFTGEDIQRNLARLGKYRIPLKELSNEIGKRTKRAISPQRISAILKSDRPTEAAVKRIADGLGVDPAELIRGEVSSVLAVPKFPVPVQDVPQYPRDLDPPAEWGDDPLGEVNDPFDDPMEFAMEISKINEYSKTIKSVFSSDVLFLTRDWTVADLRRTYSDVRALSRAARSCMHELREAISRAEADEELNKENSPSTP